MSAGFQQLHAPWWGRFSHACRAIASVAWRVTGPTLNFVGLLGGGMIAGALWRHVGGAPEDFVWTGFVGAVCGGAIAALGNAATAPSIRRNELFSSWFGFTVMGFALRGSGRYATFWSYLWTVVAFTGTYLAYRKPIGATGSDRARRGVWTPRSVREMRDDALRAPRQDEDEPEDPA